MSFISDLKKIREEIPKIDENILANLLPKKGQGQG